MPREAGLDSSTSCAARELLLPAGSMLTWNCASPLHLCAATIASGRSRPHCSHLLTRTNANPRRTLDTHCLLPRNPDCPALAEICGGPYTVYVGVRRSFSAPV